LLRAVSELCAGYETTDLWQSFGLGSSTSWRLPALSDHLVLSVTSVACLLWLAHEAIGYLEESTHPRAAGQIQAVAARVRLQGPWNISEACSDLLRKFHERNNPPENGMQNVAAAA